jgi:hypothetical protein
MYFEIKHLMIYGKHSIQSVFGASRGAITVSVKAKAQNCPYAIATPLLVPAMQN